MKKLGKLFLSLALVLVMVVPMLTMTGCDLSDLFGGNKDKDGDKTISRIELTDDVKTEYMLNDDFDRQNAQLRVVYSDESDKEVNIVSTMISGFDTTVYGNNKTMTITYAEKTIEVKYNVKMPFELGKYLMLNEEGTSYYSFEYNSINIFTCIEFADNGVLYIYTSDMQGNKLTSTQIGQISLDVEGTWVYSQGKITINAISQIIDLGIVNATKISWEGGYENLKYYQKI